MARQLGLKQKSLFDQLVEDEEILGRVAARARPVGQNSKDPISGIPRRQKTFVLSKRALQVLNSVARLQDIPRDLLVEISIQRLQPILTAEQEKYRKRTRVLQEMILCQQQLQQTMIRAEKLLGEEDKATMLLEKMVRTARESVEDLAGIIEEGKVFQNEVGSP